MTLKKNQLQNKLFGIGREDLSGFSWVRWGNKQAFSTVQDLLLQQGMINQTQIFKVFNNIICYEEPCHTHITLREKENIVDLYDTGKQVISGFGFAYLSKSSFLD